MSGSRDRLDDSGQRDLDETRGVRRWLPVVVVLVAFAVVLVGIGAAVYIGEVTLPQAGPAPVLPGSPVRLAGPRCIALNLAAVGSPAQKVAGSYRLRVLVGDNGGACVLRPAAVSFVAEGPGGSRRAFAAPAAAVQAGPVLVVDYEVRFAPGCHLGQGQATVMLRVDGALLTVTGATIPAGLAACHHVTVAGSSYR